MLRALEIEGVFCQRDLFGWVISNNKKRNQNPNETTL